MPTLYQKLDQLSYLCYFGDPDKEPFNPLDQIYQKRIVKGFSEHNHAAFQEIADELLSCGSNVESEVNQLGLATHVYPLFVWAAKNNRVDLLHSENFNKIIKNYPNAGAHSLRDALYFEAFTYAEKLIDIQFSILEKKGLGYPIMDFHRMLSKTLDFICQWGDERAFRFMLSRLPAYQFNLKDFDVDQFNPKLLHTAITYRKTGVVKLLLENGCNPQASLICSFNKSPLNLAISFASTEIIELLVKHGASLTSFPEEKPPLHYAVIQKQWEIASWLIKKYGLKIDTKDNQGKTPLDYVEDEAVKNKLRLDADSLPQPPADVKTSPIQLSLFKRINTNEGIEEEKGENLGLKPSQAL